MSNTDKLTEALIQFRNERDCEQFHNPKDLAPIDAPHEKYISFNEMYLPIMITFNEQYYFGYEQN